MDQPEVAFLDQVGQRKPAVPVMLGDADDEAQIVLDQPLPGLEIAPGHCARKRAFLFGAQQQVLRDLVQVDLGDVVDDVGAEPRCGLGKRQLRREAVGFRTRRGHYGVYVVPLRVL
jgi:hypothetical protein